MKLQKATSSIVSYPKRQHIKPILLSASVTMILTACTPPRTAGKMPNKNPTETQENNNSAYVFENPSPEIEHPVNIAGGIPVFIPEPSQEQNNTWDVTPK